MTTTLEHVSPHNGRVRLSVPWEVMIVFSFIVSVALSVLIVLALARPTPGHLEISTEHASQQTQLDAILCILSTPPAMVNVGTIAQCLTPPIEEVP